MRWGERRETHMALLRNRGQRGRCRVLNRLRRSQRTVRASATDIMLTRKHVNFLCGYVESGKKSVDLVVIIVQRILLR